MLQANAGNLILSETKKIRFVTALDIIKGRKPITEQRLLLTCTPISKLPANIGTMGPAGWQPSPALKEDIPEISILFKFSASPGPNFKITKKYFQN